MSSPEKRPILPRKGILRAVLAFVAVFLLVFALELVFPHFSTTFWWWWILGIAVALLAYRGRV